jgi:hypothetical protein
VYAVRSTARHVAVYLSLCAINPLVAFYDIHGGKREVLFFYFVSDTTRVLRVFIFIIININYTYIIYVFIRYLEPITQVL